ncbi:beta-galactosidase [Psychromonas sp. MME2]|uniref:beta-galactosidase n=1 Tax=Psychromonas sp. MME2 TaxID=3231033 RepID=UPI00339BBA07
MIKNKLSLVIPAILLGVVGCQSTDTKNTAIDASSNTATSLPDFETASFLSNAQTSHASAELVSKSGVTAGKNAVQINFEAVSEANKFKYWPNAKFFPQGEPWNWNNKGSFKVDVTNPTDTEAYIIFKLVDNVGQMGAATNQLNYATQIPAGETRTVEMLFNGGKRNLPGYWDGQNLNLRKLAELQVFVQGPIDAQTVILDNFELIDATGDFISAEEKVIEAGSIPTLQMITEFDDGELSFVDTERSVATNINKVKTQEGQGLHIKFTATDDYPNVTFKAQEPWDWSVVDNFSLAFEIENPTDDAVQMFLRVDQAENKNWGGTADGVKDSISSYMTLQPHEKATYYMPLSQLDGKIVSGMRSEPPKKSYNAQAISYGWGEKSLDLSNIVSIQLYLQNPTKDAEIIVDSIRLITNIDADTSRYEGLVDKFGQFRGDDWNEKIKSVEELRTQGQEELANIGKSQPMQGRCKFGGWADGPRLKATGHFRTEKTDGQWNLVDPEGCLFFMTGLDNIRMDDTVTITGIDFTNPEKREGAELKSELRRSMFEWLPEYSDPLAESYDYAGYVHSGAVQKGEVFSFYRANLMRKYDTNKEKAMKIWREVTLDRMQEWGFTTLGNWIDPAFYGTTKVAYEAHGWINGKHARISTGNDYWGPIHDPFDPEFKVSARDMAEGLAKQLDKNDPWLVGIFVDNEISWGNVLNEANHFGLIINALSYNVKESPAKAAFSSYLKGKYTTIKALNNAWNTNVSSWKEFDTSFDHREKLNKGMKNDYSAMLTLLSEKYFSTVDAELNRVLPNHMYLGARFADWGVTPEIAAGAAKYVDVMSYNLYANDLNNPKKAHFKKWLAKIDKPSVIGEFHFGSTDTGLFHGGIVSASNQANVLRCIPSTCKV